MNCVDLTADGDFPANLGGKRRFCVGGGDFYRCGSHCSPCSGCAIARVPLALCSPGNRSTHIAGSRAPKGLFPAGLIAGEHLRCSGRAAAGDHTRIRPRRGPDGRLVADLSILAPSEVSLNGIALCSTKKRPCISGSFGAVSKYEARRDRGRFLGRCPARPLIRVGYGWVCRIITYLF